MCLCGCCYWSCCCSFVGYEINTLSRIHANTCTHTHVHTHTPTPTCNHVSHRSECLLLAVDFPIILRVFYSECQNQHKRPWNGRGRAPATHFAPIARKQIDCDIYRTPVAFGPSRFARPPCPFPWKPWQA